MTVTPNLIASAGAVIASVPMAKVLYSVYKSIDYMKQARAAKSAGDRTNFREFLAASKNVAALGNLVPPWAFICISLGIGLQVIAAVWTIWTEI